MIWKLLLDGINSRLEIAEEKTTELEDTAIVIIHNETHRGKDQKKNVDSQQAVGQREGT